MHVALRTPELRAAIFKQLPPTALVALAGTCTQLSEPALGCLWYELENFGAISSLLAKGDHAGDALRSGMIDPEDVDRVRYYGQFVQRLVVRPSSIGITGRVLSMVITALGNNLFPNLRHFHHMGLSEHVLYLYRVVPPSLLSLVIDMVDSSDDVSRDAMGLLTTAISSLKRQGNFNVAMFSLRLPPDFPLWPVANIIAGWKSLKRLSLQGRIDANAVAAIHSLPHLTILDLCCLAGESLPCCWQKELSSLRALNICVHATSMHEVAAVLAFGSQSGAMCYSPISRMHIEGLRDTLRTRNMGEQMREQCSAFTLVDLILRSDRDSQPSGIQSDALTMRDLHPYLSFVNLRHVVIVLNGPLEICDDDLQSLALAWRQIRSLHLEGSTSTTTLCTLKGLIYLVRHCKDLEQLTIALHSTSIAFPIKKADVRHHTLQHINFLNSPIAIGKETIFTAMFMAMYFPFIPRISSTGEDSQRAWEEVVACQTIMLWEVEGCTAPWIMFTVGHHSPHLRSFRS
ncbi:uncharacterized protein SCHCODRAFT_02492213 [Schizophyllum commune H4-8]|nr:uncharacterized protein SCHCODRAFT_02492213 [Schizophyllum commune H4-8]KAI5896177.1 hypothetical protein SCHCODRAFT_02492213 [Schizophyllum commune H4-8]